MRLIVLISIAALITVAAIGSYMHYRSWNAGRFDAIIVEAAEPHGVDPALLRAIVEVQRRNTIPEELGENESFLISDRVALAYLEGHDRQAWRYVCPNRHFPNHDPGKPEEFTSEREEFKKNKSKQTCRARSCGQPLVYELHELRTNLDVVAWLLADARRYIESRNSSLGPHELRQLTIVAYRWGLPGESGRVKLTSEQGRYVREIEQAYALFRPQFDPRAKRRRDARDLPSAPF